MRDRQKDNDTVCSKVGQQPAPQPMKEKCQVKIKKHILRMIRVLGSSVRLSQSVYTWGADSLLYMECGQRLAAASVGPGIPVGFGRHLKVCTNLVFREVHVC